MSQPLDFTGGLWVTRTLDLRIESGFPRVLIPRYGQERWDGNEAVPVRVAPSFLLDPCRTSWRPAVGQRFQKRHDVGHLGGRHRRNPPRNAVVRRLATAHVGLEPVSYT